MMIGSIVRGLIAGAALLTLAGVAAAVGVPEVSDAAAVGTFITLLLLLALVLFDDSWEQADAPSDALPPADPLTSDASSTAA